jgi:hypothetical protein
MLLGGSGGNFESVAVINIDPSRPIFFTTEDHESGTSDDHCVISISERPIKR